MSFYKRLESDFSFYDDRGMLVQLARRGYEQINVLVTKAGVTRGRHYHKETTEAFYVVDGMVTVVFERDGRSGSEDFREGDFFCVLPNVWHTMHFRTKTTLVALYEHGVEREDGTKDIFTD